MTQQAGVDNGAFIPTGQIYNKVLEVEKSVIQLNTMVKVVGFFIGPALSVLITQLINAMSLGG